MQSYKSVFYLFYILPDHIKLFKRRSNSSIRGRIKMLNFNILIFDHFMKNFLQNLTKNVIKINHNLFSILMKLKKL